MRSDTVSSYRSDRRSIMRSRVNSRDTRRRALSANLAASLGWQLFRPRAATGPLEYDVALPDSMKRAMAKQAEAERERRAKIVNAEGEFQAAEKMVQAAAMISKEPIALQLRFLQTMREISSEHNTTTFLPVPIDLFSPFLKK